MGVAEQREWFIKWQNCSSKERFQLIEYVERTVAAQETIEDDVDAWIPYWKWRDEQRSEKTEPQLLDEWNILLNHASLSATTAETNGCYQGTRASSVETANG